MTHGRRNFAVLHASIDVTVFLHDRSDRLRVPGAQRLGASYALLVKVGLSAAQMLDRSNLG